MFWTPGTPWENSIGAVNVSGNKITGNSPKENISEEKKNKKKVLNLVKMSLSIRRSHKKDFFYASYFEYSHPDVI